MERKCNSKIRNYFIIYLVFLLVFSFFMYMLARHESLAQRQRMLALLAAHPELETEILSIWKEPEHRLPLNPDISGSEEELSRITERLETKYGYRPEQLASLKGLGGFWAAGALAGLFSVADLWLLEREKNARFQKNLRELYECLEQFREGWFEGIPDYETDSQFCSEEWMKIWEALRELGNYFEDLRRSLQKEKDHTKSLITDISHQLKTPLASLKMCCELASESQLSQEERSVFQEQEKREIEKLKILMKELVNLSRLESNIIELRPAAASLKKTIAGAVSQVFMRARDKDITIQVEMEEDLEIFHDAKWTAEAIVNVLDNSVKYSEEHTEITVRAIRLVSNLLIEIKDQGMGIPKKELSKIYQRFYRGSEAMKTQEDGAGIGLYLTRMILERQGGTISAKPGTKKGTLFRITLPR